MMELTNESLRSPRDWRRAYSEEIAKLRKELEIKRRAHTESKIQLEAAFDEEKGLRGATESRIQALEGELKEARGVLSRTEADLNRARARIRSAVSDFKNSPAFDNHIELRRQQWLVDFQQSEGYRSEIKFATLNGANRVLDKLKALHPEWNFIEEIRREIPRPQQQPPAQPLP